MHELAIAQSIVDSVLDEATRAKAKRVESIDIEAGELMQLDVPVLKGALTGLLAGPILSGASVAVRKTKARFACRRCGREWGMSEVKKQLKAVPDDLRVREPDSVEIPLHFLPYLYPTFVKCPRCGSSDTGARSGEDIRLRRVLME